ncbi:MAG: glycoside hydrolase family 43 protein [Alistipes sp.]|nr:glycoside hydrolase family 43 protein [Alistipes sp.]
MSRLIARIFFAAITACFCGTALYCHREPQVEEGDHFYNPVFTAFENITPCFHEGRYYFISALDDRLNLYVTEDPTALADCEPRFLFDFTEKMGLEHVWHPYLSNIGGVWYIHFNGDHGNTDDHQIYVAMNPHPDPLDGEFELVGRISTDPEDNWAIHSHVFEYDGELYMVWSGWESRRVFAETQCIFIARMENPWTLATERVLLSRPEFEWERQWMAPAGYRSTYPIFVNEAPYFFCTEQTDKAYIYYSASALWTPYMAVGELSAEKGSDLADAASWTKNHRPVFRESKQNGVTGPGYPRFFPSPDGTEYYVFYIAGEAGNPYKRTVRMQQLGFSPGGKPLFGEPVPMDQPQNKPSGVPSCR